MSIISSGNRKGKGGARKLLNLLQLYEDTIFTFDFISGFSSPGRKVVGERREIVYL